MTLDSLARGNCGLLLLMQWTAPTTGIAMCQSAVAIAERRESPLGYSETFSGEGEHVRSYLKADLKGLTMAI